MAQVIFFNVPAHGHINPSLPLVAELVRRGHQVVYFASDGFRAGIEATGAAFRSYASVDAVVGDDFFASRQLNGSAPQRTAHTLITTTQAILPALLTAVRAQQPDCVLYDGMCPWGYFVARVLNAPAVASLSLLPPVMPPGAMLRPHMLRLIASAVLRDIDKGMAANNVSRALGKQYNVVPLGTMELLNAPGDVSISYTSPYFLPHADLAPKHIRFVGWTPHESAGDHDQLLPIADGRLLVYASLGTMINDNASFYRACIEAFAGSEFSVIISTGKGLSSDSFGATPSNVSVRAWVPQVTILKRAALFITHGGMNSVHDGLYFGVPLLLVPQQSEQTITAMRVAELGAGIMLDQSRVTPESIWSSTRTLLSETRFKAEANRVGESLHATGGAPKGADAVEAVMSGGAQLRNTSVTNELDPPT